MKIVQLINGLPPAGAEKVVLELCRGLLAAGHDPVVVTLLPAPFGSFVEDELIELGIPIHSIFLEKKNPWRILGLRKLLGQLQPDLVHSHLYYSNLAVRLAALNRTYPVINTVHNAERRLSKQWIFVFDSLTRNLCDQHTAVSKAVLDFHCKKTGLAPAKMRVIYNGFLPPAPLLAEEIIGLRNEWGLGECDTVLGSVGRLTHQKGYDILLRLLPEVAKRIPPGKHWGLVILGDGEERDHLEGLARKAPTNLTVKLAGYRPDADRCLGAFDLFLLPSRFEGFGLTLVEAMAHGVPVLANRVDSVPELLKNYSHGRMLAFDLRNASTVSRKIAEMVQNKSKPCPLVEFTTDKMLAGYLGLYQELVGKTV